VASRNCETAGLLTSCLEKMMRRNGLDRNPRRSGRHSDQRQATKQ
jgi:hypothetical protein